MVKMENNIAFSPRKFFIALLIWGFLPSTPGAAADLPLYELKVSFDLKTNLVKGLSTITLKDETVVSVGDLKIMSVMLNDKPLDYEIKYGQFKSPKGTLEVVYEGKFGEEDEVYVVSRGIISEQGISLTGMWYPQIEGLAFYKLAAVLPEGFIAVSEADEITVQGTVYSFHFPHPLQRINLAAGRYKEFKGSSNTTDIYGYFFPEDVHLAKTYLEYTKRYLEMYEDLLGPYPYKRFSVVENILPTGFSMPTYTLLGRRVVRLPFIVETSLGHEVLHQWFGNLVYGDLEKGNWLEAITTYLADHLYEEQKRSGWDYRKKILIDYLSYVNPTNETALEGFAQPMDSASRAIGYGKGAMVFHMLKNLVGEDIFYTSLRELVSEKKFQLASWDDIRGSFEKASGMDLGWFFTQWLTRKGVVTFEIEDPLVLFVKAVPTVFFSVVQPDEPYRFDLPVRIITEEGEVSEILNIKRDKEFFNIPLDGTPLEMVFDEQYDLMRRVAKEEFPPVVARLFGDEKRIVVVPEEDEKYTDLVEVLKKEGFRAKGEKEFSVGRRPLSRASPLR
jgi:aminopeptidase N